VAIMPRENGARVGTANKRVRSERLRQTPSALVGEPEPRHRARIENKLPSWLPQPIAAHARQIICRTASDELLLRRLASDFRMKGVWTELLKRKRFNYKSSEEFRYPATPRLDWSPEVRAKQRRVQTLRRTFSPINENEAKKLEVYAALNRFADVETWGRELPVQDRALVAFFDQAFEFARSNSSPVPRAVAQKKRAHYLEMASRIRADAEQHDPIQGVAVVGLAGVGSVHARLPLLEAALAYEELADKVAPPPGHPLLVGRKRRGDERQTGFVLELVDATRAIFDNALRGIVAIVANVAFECEYWTAERVRKAAIIPRR
jgi:hypothetical protein